MRYFQTHVEKKSIKERKPIIATFLTFVAPGLGQLYNGQLKQGCLFYLKLTCLVVISFLLWSQLVLFYPSFWTVALGVPLYIIAFAYLIYTAVGCYHQAKQLGNSYKLKGYNKWYAYLLYVFLCFSISNLITGIGKAYYIQAYRIPSGAMLPTLQIGDHILVNKLFYKMPQRADIIVFKYPEDESKNFIKRVIGEPADSLEIKDKQVYVNGKALDEPYTIHRDPTIYPKGSQPRDNLGPIVVPERDYFVLGDNRDQSLDSRFWGFVETREIKGKAFIIYWSWDPQNANVRWDRVGQRIN